MDRLNMLLTGVICVIVAVLAVLAGMWAQAATADTTDAGSQWVRVSVNHGSQWV